MCTVTGVMRINGYFVEFFLTYRGPGRMHASVNWVFCTGSENGIWPLSSQPCHFPWINADYKPFNQDDFDGLAKDCSNSSALAMELLQFCAKPPTCLNYISMEMLSAIREKQNRTGVTRLSTCTKRGGIWTDAWVCLHYWVVIWVAG